MTVRELARLTGVSPATVSIVLNGGKGVSEPTRKKVLDAIAASNYVPPPARASRARTVLLLKYCQSGMFVEENQGFITMIIDAVEEQLRQERCGMTMTAVRGDLRAALAAQDFAKYCGVILIGTEFAADSFDALQSIPIPFVVVDNTAANHPCSSVCMNNAENVYLALRHCRACGHTEIGYLGSTSDTANFRERRRAFRDGVAALGLHFEPRWEFRVTATMLGAHNDFLTVLDGAPALPPCFFAENDTIALGVLKALQERGFAVPQEISLIGFDDIPYASISTPALTTVHVQRGIIGRQAVLQLLQIMADPGFAPLKTQITGRLVVRDSVCDRRAQG